MATALTMSVKHSIKHYAVLWHLWPQQAMIDGECQQVGFDLEFMGCHTLDPAHLDPSCPLCHRVREALLQFAQHVAVQVLAYQPVTYRIDSHSASIVCTPGLGNRPSVPVSIIVTQPSKAPGVLGTVIGTLRQFLGELGISEH